VLAATWLEAAGITAVPVVFVLQEGRIAWIGHPFGLREQTLLQLREGAYPWERAVQDYAMTLNHAEELEKSWKRMQATMENGNFQAGENLLKAMMTLLPPAEQVGLKALHFQMYIARSRTQEAMALAAELAEQYPEEPQLLNLLAWELATNDDFEKPNAPLILKIAERANAAAYGRDAHILDTYARALFLNGQKEAAIQAQTRAVQLAPEDWKNKFEEILRAYKRGELPEVDE
jgi:Flp pilus assembly protein TadD